MEQDERSSPAAGTPGSRAKARSDQLMKRVSRACLHCRQRKSKCDLDSSGSPGVPPCQRCIWDNRECVLGSSNRGGRRIRKNKMQNFTPDSIASGRRDSIIEPASPTNSENHQTTASSSYPGPVVFVAPDPPTAPSLSVEDEDTASIGSVPRNPSDAWQCLTGIAKRGADGPSPGVEAEPLHVSSNSFTGLSALRNGSVTDFPPNSGIKAYRLVQSRSLDTGTVWQLVVRYAEHFHPYLPLVPRKYFERSALDTFASNEKHLLTAVLTIASKDLVERPEIHEYCSKYMHELISGIAAGADCDVEAVEALLLLAEWEPQGLRPRIEKVGRGEEDRAAWMHVGLALRSGYFLGLDRTSFRGDSSGDTETEARRRLAWTSCYVSDRLISVRIGRAFWSRGPGPMTGLVSQDFPSLQPINEGEEDYARIFQATLDLTQLYNNVHDVLYSGMRASNQMMLMGDYVKYVDDFRLAILRWKSLWGSLSCSTPMKVTLQLSYEYLRLYTNAFAFQAAISQSLVSKMKNDDQCQREYLRATFNNVASMQDARFIYESVDAAKAYLTILVDVVDPEKHLHFMPLRFYLYGIYSAVFLYKARSFGVIMFSEEMRVRDLVTKTTQVLRRASAGPDDIGSRYSRLLELLWQQKSMPAASSAGTHQESGMPMHHDSSTLPHQTSDPHVHFSPANDFSWLDLEAVGDYVSGDQMSGTNSLALDTFQNPDLYSAGQDRPQSWQVPTWSGDMNSNLFF
ncbi:C6 zinc finger domain protein [Aspergillus saccharolyticus JOP 1030-1]|uniref:C6 zinc finger domain protein n=1 Tax=Aspergillus saccharolyticus JOP 1030-1 TaxID=1450539 RepID=A0A318ZMG8_9EURO|nr:C6 zinc finger domain protein [Aspergillus saccharolyticus JOP 1030-1]PYH45633.1 C6 zinc finger domain protein [Aspergillus saccharolyticus JOP 1030-1]